MAKILIMDDEPGLRNVIFTMLKPTGHTLYLAEDGKQAIETAQKEKPDLALLDMRVPDYDGLEVLAELKKMDPTIQCVMLSGFGDVETAVGAIKKGAFDYLSKPFKVNEVLEVVNRALAQKTSKASAEKTATTFAGQEQAGVKINVPSTYIPTKKPPVAILAGVAALLIVVVGAIFFSGSGRLTYLITYSNPTAIAYDGKNLWISDWVGRSIYKHKVDKTLSVENVVSFSEHIPIGIAWDGSSLWSCDNMRGIIIKHMPNQHLTQILALKTPFSPSVMGFDGANLWVGDIAGKIYKFRLVGQGLEPVRTYDTVAQQITSIFFRDNYVWISDAETGKVYKHDPVNFSVAGIYMLKPYDKRKERVGGILYDGKHLWSCVEGAGKIYRHSGRDLVIAR